VPERLARAERQVVTDLDTVLANARGLQRHFSPVVRQLADDVVAMLGVGMPCIWPEPRLCTEHERCVVLEAGDGDEMHFEREEAIGYAVQMIRVAMRIPEDA
jgi:hypothetical protein